MIHLFFALGKCFNIIPNPKTFCPFFPISIPIDASGFICTHTTLLLSLSFFRQKIDNHQQQSLLNSCERQPIFCMHKQYSNGSSHGSNHTYISVDCIHHTRNVLCTELLCPALVQYIKHANLISSYNSKAKQWKNTDNYHHQLLNQSIVFMKINSLS